MIPENKEYEIPEYLKKEKTDFWLDVWEGWLERAAINLDWKPSPIPYNEYEKSELVAILKEFQREVLIHLKQVVFIREKRKKERKKKREKMSKPSDQNKTVDSNVHDSSAHERLDMLWRFASDQNERLIQADQRLDALEEEKRKHFAEQKNLEHAFDERIFKLEFWPEIREKKIDGLEERLTALEKQIACLPCLPCLPESFKAAMQVPKGGKEDAQTAV